MEHVKISIQFFNDIENALKHNTATSHSYAKAKSKEVLRILIEGGTIEIMEENVILNNVEEYKEWKKHKEYLNIFNSDLLINEIEKNTDNK